MKRDSSPKRLFLVAGYSAKNIVDASLVYYVQNLSKYGDIVLVMDNDIPAAQLKNNTQYVIYVNAHRHGEYDFGSYKRAYIYAHRTGILSKYEFVYMVNDSVYGPTCALGPILNQIESRGLDMFGMTYNPHPYNAHVQSWFIGMRPSVFMAPWYDKFMRQITALPTKGDITILYETGFTRLVAQNGMTYGALYITPHNTIYNNICKLSKRGLPFIKKCAFTRHNGRLGGQICRALEHADNAARTAIIQGARETLGTEYIDWLLTKNPFKIMYRSIKYFIHKIFNEGL